VPPGASEIVENCAGGGAPEPPLPDLPQFPGNTRAISDPATGEAVGFCSSTAVLLPDRHEWPTRQGLGALQAGHAGPAQRAHVPHRDDGRGPDSRLVPLPVRPVHDQSYCVPRRLLPTPRRSHMTCGLRFARCYEAAHSLVNERSNRSEPLPHACDINHPTSYAMRGSRRITQGRFFPCELKSGSILSLRFVYFVQALSRPFDRRAEYCCRSAAGVRAVSITAHPGC
jgi:hypothetical protein